MPVFSLEICAGAGGQALGLEQAGFEHLALVENDPHACNTLRLNRPNWNVIERDVKEFSFSSYEGVDLLAGGLPCPPFSKAGKQLGSNDERNLFPEAIRLIDECRPRAILIENVRGMLDPVFLGFREEFSKNVIKMGYKVYWKLLNSSDYGVPQLRPRVVFVALKSEIAHNFSWPEPDKKKNRTVGSVLYDLMAENGWKNAKDWREMANNIAPTIVGGSKKHGGPDLGPTRSKKAWEKLGVNGKLIAYDPPPHDFEGMPYLTVRMVAKLQGFPDEWEFYGKKTHSYRQVGNAFPPPVAQAVGKSIMGALLCSKKLMMAV